MGVLSFADCLERMAEIPAGSVDMILCDLPYGMTRNPWDSIVPIEPLWREIWRVTTDRAAVVLTAAQPFTTTLIASQMTRFCYDWVWKKPPSSPLNAKKRPMPAHESILVFGNPVYRPQGLRSTERKRGAGDVSRSTNYGSGQKPYTQTVTGYPVSVVEFKKDTPRVHPTQKPVGLFQYLIETYSDPGDLVLDMTAGYATTAIAAEACGRRWHCIENDPDMYVRASQRIIDHLKG